MSDTLKKILLLVAAGDVTPSLHGLKELANDGISLREVLEGVQYAIVVEDYPSFAKGPCVLVCQQDATGRPIHALWGVRIGTERPAVLVTAYRPDPARWSPDFLTRKLP